MADARSISSKFYTEDGATWLEICRQRQTKYSLGKVTFQDCKSSLVETCYSTKQHPQSYFRHRPCVCLIEFLLVPFKLPVQDCTRILQILKNIPEN